MRGGMYVNIIFLKVLIIFWQVLKDEKTVGKTVYLFWRDVQMVIQESMHGKCA